MLNRYDLAVVVFIFSFTAIFIRQTQKKNQFYHSREILLKLVPYGYIISNFVY